MKRTENKIIIIVELTSNNNNNRVKHTHNNCPSSSHCSSSIQHLLPMCYTVVLLLAKKCLLVQQTSHYWGNVMRIKSFHWRCRCWRMKVYRYLITSDWMNFRRSSPCSSTTPPSPYSCLFCVTWTTRAHTKKRRTFRMRKATIHVPFLIDDPIARNSHLIRLALTISKIVRLQLFSLNGKK